MQDAMATDRRQQAGGRQPCCTGRGYNARPHRQCGQSAQVFLMIGCGPRVVITVSLELPKLQPQGLLEGAACLQHPQKQRRKNEWPACAMESVVECYLGGTPKNYNRGSFDLL